MEDLNENERLILQDLFESSDGNGHDFGYTDEVDCKKIGIARKQLSGYISQLSQKEYIYVHANDGEPWNQFTLTKKGLDYFGIRSD